MIYLPLTINLICLASLIAAVLVEGDRHGWFCGVWSFLIFLAGVIVTLAAWLSYLTWIFLS